MTPEQAALVEQAKILLHSDARVAAGWLAGSLGRGAGDEVSDVDLLALCADGTRSEVSQSLARTIRNDFDPLLLNVLFGGVVLNVVADGWKRFDISLIEAGDLDRYDPTKLTTLFDRTGAQPNGIFPSTYHPSAQSVLPIVEEFLRVIGLAPVVITRGDFVLMLSGIEHLRRLTMDLMLEENRVAPWNRGGALTRRALLTGQQYAELEALPPLSADRSSAKANNEGFARIFLPRAKQLCAEVGAPWPERFEAATREHLAKTVGFVI